MAVTDFFAGEIITELLKNLLAVSKKSWTFKDSANGLIESLQQLLPIIQEIKYSGVELPAIRQSQLDRLSETLRQGHELAHKVLLSSRYNIYKNLQYARKMEKIEKTVAKFIQGPLQAHILADVHHIRFETTERFDRLEQSLSAMKIGACGGGVSWMEEAVRRVEEEEGRMQWESSSELVLGLGFGLKKVKEMVLGGDDLIVGISGIGGSGKTTLVKELVKDDHVRSYFGERILFLTVSQSPDVDDLKAKILGFIMGGQVLSPTSVLPQMSFQFEWKNPTKTLVVLDDVWSLSTLQPLLFNIPGCRTLVVSRIKFPTVVKATYDVELLGEDEAVSLFCHSAFGQKSIPPGADRKLVKQIVDECKRLPLALKVIGSSLRDQPEMIWANASKRLSRGESIGESHETDLLDRMAISVNCLSPKVRECFLDLGAFPEDKKIPLDVLINIWVETHDHIDEELAFAILNELADKNLVTLVKDARDGDIYSSCYDISVTQHDVLRDLALHLSNNGSINQRTRLLMPRREIELPREWDRHSDEPFQARIVSIHTGEMTEMDWFEMEFPKAEVLILNFASNEYMLPPFIRNMPKLKALIMINYSASNAILHDFSVFSSLSNLRSLWLEKVSVPPLSPATFPSKKVRKISLILCKINNSLDESAFPRLLELTIDHCDDLLELPSSICRMHLLTNLSITNCHHLWQLPADLSKLKSLQILRLYACPYLQENEEKNENAEFRVKEVQYIQAEVKIIKCLVENIVVDISFNQLGGLCTLCFLEEVDHLINQNHLFKRSIILIKAWCYYESRILGAHHGLISTYALETLVLYIFHVFNNSFAGPLEVLYRFLEFFSKFDWENFCVSLWGPVPISSLPDVTAEPPRKDGGDLLLSKLFLDACSQVYAVFPGGQENQGQAFVSKHFNVIDPLRVNNNLGRSVSKGNFFRIRSAFAFGAKRLARLLDCAKEDLCFEVNQFFLNTWDRHGSGHRPDAPHNDLRRLRLSNADHLQGSENRRNNLSSQKIESSSGRDTQGEGKHGSPSVSSQHGSYPIDSTSRKSDLSSVTDGQIQKSHVNMNFARASDQIRKEINPHLGGHVDKGQRKPDSLVNDLHGRFLFARTRSSPELTDSYSEVPSQGRQNRAPESGKSQTYSTRLDNSRRKNLEADTFASHSIRSSADDPSSANHISSHQSLDVVGESNNSYHDESGLSTVGDDFPSISGTQGMHQEEQDLVNMMASSAAHGFNGQVHLPLNFGSGQLPFPIPPSVLASMGYAQRNMGGMFPTNFPLMESPWGTNMHFPQGVVPSPLTHYFPGMGMTSNPEESASPENFGSVELNSSETDHDFWHNQERGSTSGFDLDNGGLEMLEADDRQQSTSAGYNSHPSSRIGAAVSSMRVQQKSPKESRDSMREDHVDDFQYQDNRGNEVYFDDRVSSRSLSATYTSSARSKTSSESSWEGSSAKVSKSTREKRGRKAAMSTAPSTSFGKGKSVSEHSSTQADDENKDWNLPTSLGAEMIERSTLTPPVASLHVPRHQVPGFEPSQTSGSDSVMPFPVLLGPGSRQRSTNDSGPTYAFYATGPPVPFVTWYNIPAEAGTSDVSSQLSREDGPESDSGQNFDSAEGTDQPDLRLSNSMGRVAPIEPSEYKSDILHSDFLSHYQNLIYGRKCQNPQHSPPMVYPSSGMVPPVYMQGRLPWDGPGRPLSANMNLISQLYGPRIVPVAAPLQSVSNRPASVYQRYVDEIPRYRSGTGTYLPNPKVSVRDRHTSSARRGSYNYDRNDHHGDREGNWNANSKSRASGRNHSRSQAEKPNMRVDRMAASESRAERPWSSHRHDSFPSYQSQNGPIRSSTTQSGSTNVAYGMYPLPGMNPNGASSNGPTMPSLVMIYPYDHNAGYGPPPTDQLEFGSLGPVGFSGLNEGPQLNEGSRMGGVFEEQRFHGGSTQRSSPDQPSSPHIHRGV